MPTNEPSSPSELPSTLEAGSSAELPAASSLRPSLSLAFLQRFLRQSQQQSRWILWAVVVATATVTGAIAFQWLTALPEVPNCKNFLGTALSKSQQLYCADQTASKGDEAALTKALKLAGEISPVDPMFEQAKQLSNTWSNAVLVMARQKVEAGDLEKGIQLAEQVPEHSNVHGEAQAAIADWRSNWQKGEVIFKKAKAAIQDQDWTVATEQVRNLVQLDSDYWKKRADVIVAEISVEQQAFAKISSAQDLVDYGSPDDIAKAIQQVSQVDPKRLARKKAMQKIDEWSQKLIDVAQTSQQYGDFDDVISTAQKVPPSSKLSAVANAYLQMGRAEKVAQDGSLWAYIQAYAYANQIEPDTSVYTASQQRRQNWERQIQGWGQLALAEWVAHFDLVGGYETAIAQAQLIDADAPRRVEAQTLIAHWTNQINTFDNRQFIARAKQLALTNTTNGFMSAIAEVEKVLSGQPLWEQARTLAANWTDGIEKLEDQPILDRARAFAQNGDFESAIRTAEGIDRDRALFSAAQDDIYKWVSQVQIAADRPILNEADSLASQGSLSAAIARASDIGYGRALYWDAQSRIADWAAQRRQIEQARQPQPDPPEASSDSSEPYEDNLSDPIVENNASFDPYNNAAPQDSDARPPTDSPEPSPDSEATDEL